MTLAGKLVLLRKEKHLAPRDVAYRLDFELSDFLEWEQGHRSPDILQLKLLSDFYNVSLEYLLDNEIADKSTHKIFFHKPSFLEKIKHFFQR